MKSIFIICIAAALMLFIMMDSCKHQPQEVIKPSSHDTTKPFVPIITNCSSDTVYFKNTILPILISNCNGPGCHNAADQAENIVLDNYTNIRKIVSPGNLNSKLYVYINSSKKPMPPSGKMPQATIDLIKKWIEQGAKDNFCNDGCDTTAFAYAANISKLITTNCSGCHNTGSTKIGTYADLKVVADNGKLWGTINHSTGFLAMPNSTTKISDCDIKRIRKWLNAGAPNN